MHGWNGVSIRLGFLSWGQGLAVLTSSGAVLRRGFTTGTTAAAACKGAVLSLWLHYLISNSANSLWTFG